MPNPRPIEVRLREYRDINLAMADHVQALIKNTPTPATAEAADALVGLRANMDLWCIIAADLTKILDGEELKISVAVVEP